MSQLAAHLGHCFLHEQAPQLSIVWLGEDWLSVLRGDTVVDGNSLPLLFKAVKQSDDVLKLKWTTSGRTVTLVV